jgi:hypothetical protein
MDQRELAEVRRSQQKAARGTHRGSDQNEIQRYLAPASNTPFPFEYAFFVLGDLSGKTVVDLGCGSGKNLIPANPARRPGYWHRPVSGTDRTGARTPCGSRSAR